MSDCGDWDWNQRQARLGLGQAGLGPGRSSWLQQIWWRVHIELADLGWCTMFREVSVTQSEHYEKSDNFISKYIIKCVN